MGEPNEKRDVAWQPLTPAGVAAFARASAGRLWTMQFFFALMAAASVVWFLHQAWFPTIHQAIGQLPAQGQIRAGRLDWQGDSPLSLAEGIFLALVVDLDHEGLARSPAHVRLEFGRSDVQIHSLLGFAQASYPKDWRIAFNRTELEPW